MEAIIKAWLVNIEVYNLLLNISWMKRVRLSQLYANGRIIVCREDFVPIEIFTKLLSIQIDLSKVELKFEENTTADKLCQQLLNGLKNKILRLLA